MTAHPAAAGPEPRDGSPAVPWSGGRALLDVVVIYIVALVAAQLLVVTAVLLRGGDGQVPLVVLLISSPIVLLVAALAWLRIRYGSKLALVAGRARWRPSDLGVGFALGLACFVGQQLLLSAIVWVLSQFGADTPPVQDTFRAIAEDPATAPALVVTAVLLAPAGEELLFRGVLFQGLRARWGFWAAAFGSAGLFTLAHLGDASGALADAIIVAGIMPLGLIFAALMERRGSLLACVVAHATYNAGGVGLLITAAAATQ